MAVSDLVRVLVRVGVVALMLAGCKPAAAPVNEPEPCELQMVNFAVIASDRINPTDQGEARPVQFRLYQLKSDIRFLNASFDDVWKSDAEALQDDLVKVDEFPVYPNTRTELKFERDDSAQFIVAAALFMRPRGRSWYTSFELPPAPSEGSCGAQACEGDSCELEEPILNPEFYIWVDDSRVEDGVEHAEEHPQGRTERLSLPSGGDPSGGGLPGSGPVAPEVPTPSVDSSTSPPPDAPAAEVP